MPNRSKPRVLYIVYWGAAEPLGQSLVLPAVKRLSSLGVDLTLVTFEKPSDMAREQENVNIKAGLDESGVRWIPLRYHKRPKIPATGYDFVQGIVRGLASRLRSGSDIVHARTYIGGLIGLALAPLLGAKFVYHNEGFYPDEQVDAGVWKAGSIQHRVARSLENRMYGRADGIIAMSSRGRRAIEALPEIQRKGTPVIVVPSCVDLNHFRPEDFESRTRQSTLRFIYTGGVGGRYLLDNAGRFVAAASREIGPAHLRVLTRQEPELVASMLERGGLSDKAWSMDGVPYSAMPAHLAKHDVGLCFMAQGLSEHGCSPTKIGEYWAMGLPVVTTPNLSDTEEIMRREQVGVVVSDNSDAAYRRAALELRALLADPLLSKRCRQAAENYYALPSACERQVEFYSRFSSANLPRVTEVECGP